MGVPTFIPARNTGAAQHEMTVICQDDNLKGGGNVTITQEQCRMMARNYGGHVIDGLGAGHDGCQWGSLHQGPMGLSTILRN